jgi:hypothetical protein
MISNFEFIALAKEQGLRSLFFVSAYLLISISPRLKNYLMLKNS